MYLWLILKLKSLYFYFLLKYEVKGVSRRKKPTVENRRSGAKAAKIALKAWEAVGKFVDRDSLALTFKWIADCSLLKDSVSAWKANVVVLGLLHHSYKTTTWHMIFSDIKWLGIFRSFKSRKCKSPKLLIILCWNFAKQMIFTFKKMAERRAGYKIL